MCWVPLKHAQREKFSETKIDIHIHIRHVINPGSLCSCEGPRDGVGGINARAEAESVRVRVRNGVPECNGEGGWVKAREGKQGGKRAGRGGPSIRRT